LAEKERATASSTLRSREKAGAKAKQQQAKAQSKEEQAKAARAEKKRHEPFWKRLDEAFLEQLGTPAYIPGTPPPVRRIPPPPFDSPPFQMLIGKSAAQPAQRSSVIRVSWPHIR
jgi:hypothetical protein